MLLSGVFERFPRMKFVITEARPRCSRRMLKQLDRHIANVRKGEIGELKYTSENALPRSATEYFQQSVLARCELPRPGRLGGAHGARARTGSCGATTTRTTRVRAPYTKETLRAVFHDVPEAELRDVLGGNAAKLYDFDLDALAPLAAKYGPTVDELATPLTELPEKPNMALLRAAS